MCGGVLYHYEGRAIRSFFPNPDALLPIATRHGGVCLLPWGRRQSQRGRLPLGGWARLESIRGGRWDRWQPRPVRLQLSAFMERNIEGESHWFPLTSGQWVQGLVAREGIEQRVYIVTVTPLEEDAMHERWPRLVTSGR